MAGLRPHTREYDDDARRALGLAVVRAREAAGYSSRPAFVAASGVGKTSLYKLESGIPVSAAVYEAAARALPNWTEDTPRLILEGAEPPSTAAVNQSTPEVDDGSSTEDHWEWSEEYERKYRLLKEMLRSQGLEMTPRTLRIMKDEYDRLAGEQHAIEQTTQGDRS